ncbi:MAG TPA: alanine--tRNA ligase, partial [Candidatus Bathyarchaeota archaeon]|nr:alanine--tRNA ligase [Candidatus Bathyarchaeota archaeon]
HQKVSSASAKRLFKGGLSDASTETIKLHTATHLLNEALRRVLKKRDIVQKGSNITPERLRFDFNFDRPLTPEEIDAVEGLVNEQIRKALPVVREEMSVEEAKACGAQAVFDEKYGNTVSVYRIGDFSAEICGGPHISNTSELGTFKITKEKGIAAGVRRIRATLEHEKGS